MNRVKEYIIEKISKTGLFEMALDRADYLREIRNMAGQIVENWCLARHRTLFDDKNPNKNHWASELDAACYRLFKIVTKIDKKRLLETGFINELELNKADSLIRWTSRKFKIEHISSPEEIEIIHQDFIASLPRLIYLISSKDYNELYRYIDEDI